MGDDALDLIAARFRVLGDASRLRLLNLLMQGEASVQDLVEQSGLSQTNVSRHLGLLRHDRLVARTRDGNRALYRITDPSVEKLCRLVCDGIGEQMADGLDAIDFANGI
jgi:DNA-binding transcriptional ArsR family regulator